MHNSNLSPDEALQRLKEGNQRYVSGKVVHPNQTVERRQEVAQSQHPFAIILNCSDSRVAPEILFDQGLGDLFIVRTAGNVVDDVVIGSIEYAVEHLGVQLLLVLGHQRCGAVTAAVEAAAHTGSEVPGHIGSIIERIQPAVQQAQSLPGDLVINATKANVLLIVNELTCCAPILSDLVQAGKLKVVGAYYDLDCGEVSFL